MNTIFNIDFYTQILLPTGVSLAIFYLFYKAFVRNDTHLNIRRFTILGFLVFAMVLPFLHFYVSGNTAVIAGFGVFNAPLLLPVFTVFGDGGNIGYVETLHATSLQSVFNILGWIYLAIVSMLIGRIFVGVWRLSRISRNGRFDRLIDRDISTKTTVIISKNIPTAFSFFKTIFIPETWANSDEKEMVLAHERVHVNQKHSWDLMLMEVICAVQFFNPFVWLLKREMRLNHEYLADKGALKNNENPEFYFQFLLQEIVGNRACELNEVKQPILVHSLHYSPIKNRIMMQIIKPAKWLNQVRYLAFIPVALALTFLFACQEKARESEEIVFTQTSEMLNVLPDPIVIVDGVVFDGDANAIPPETIYSVNVISILSPELINSLGLNNRNVDGGVMIIRTIEFEEREPAIIVETAPEFPGGIEAMHQFLRENIVFPAEAREQRIQGTVFVTFVVERDGRISNVNVLRGIGGGADEEAARVVSMMPNWTPGKQGGEPIRMQFNMPIRFALGDETQE